LSPEAAAYLIRARELLVRGSEAVDVLGHFGSAGRDAYMAAFHAAQAVLLARTGRVAKTHNGVRTEISRVAREAASSALATATSLVAHAEWLLTQPEPPTTA
jgi:uncharacterized protein (UPF0332 family)